MCNECIKRVVKKLTKKYNTFSPEQLAKELDVEVIEAPLGKVWGMYKYQKRNNVIYINSTLSDFQKNFVLAHELGHVKLHPGSDCFFMNKTGYVSKIKREYEANLFAAELLIQEIDSIYLENYSIDQLAAAYKVPVELIKFKFGLN